MSRLIQLRLGLALIGVVIWAYGYRADDTMLRWIGIGFLAGSVVLRFAGPKRK